ncbi:MAG: glutamine-hydrolyzing carbamoyl-phosphate synthase small subunit [Clostridia bacterium]|nr:glutamine-hydrolyzing carbamoyl-phosphate synthase small subunit [Clostridia bacterium]
MKRQYDRKLVLENGTEYPGFAFGDREKECVCEVVFNTSMAGYQEIVSDPAYAGTAVVMTYPLIGNYGVADDDFESRVLSVGALIVREYNDSPSNFRYTKTLSEILEENRIPGIEGLDTRKLTRSIRDSGSMRALITTPDMPVSRALEIISNAPARQNTAADVSCKKKWYSRTSNHKFNVVAVDCGIKLSLIRSLMSRGCNVTVMPWNTGAEEIEKINPDGVIVSSGPGDPKAAAPVTAMIKALRGKYPIFGIGLGCQLVCLAYGADTYKLKFGHHGANHPVRNLTTDKVEITNQNHSFAVSVDSLEGTGLELTHINLMDNTAEGVRCKKDRVFAMQFNIDSTPAPRGNSHLFDEFTASMEEKYNA